MNTELSRRARLLAGVALLGLIATACDSTPGAVPVPSHTTTSSGTTSTSTTSSSTPTTPPPVDSTSSPGTTTKPVPTLGIVWGRSQQGYGTARPSTIDNGGDPTGLVTDVRWQSWGGPTATATGMSSDANGKASIAEAVQRQATVQAFDLGDCEGKLMYRAIEWYFPSDGQKFDPNSYIDICHGKYVGTH